MTHDEAIAEIMNILRPRFDPDLCRNEIGRSLQGVVDIFEYYSVAQPLHKAKVSAVATAIAKTEKVIAALPAPIRALWHTGLLSNELERITKATAEESNRTKLEGAAKRYITPVRSAAAERAFFLVSRWHKNRPSMTKLGPYVRTAGILFEAVTGKSADFERQCKALLKEIEENPFAELAAQKLSESQHASYDYDD